MHPWEEFTNQQQWREYIRELLAVSDKAVYKSILVIYDLQTDQEKYTGETIDHNGLGFSGIDAEDMTQMALKIQRRELLTRKELAIARNKMKKYWKQLMKVSKGEIKHEAVT
jgi:biotin carboxylase